MEFYANRIYTAINVDELESGSKCIFANTLEELRQRVQAVDVEDCTKRSSNWYYDANIKYFVSDKGTWIYAYLIEPPAAARFRNKNKMPKKIDDLQIVHLSLRDIKEIARYAGLAIDTENLPDDDTDDDYTLFYSRRSGIKFSDAGAYHIAIRCGYEDANEFMPIGIEITR